MKIWHSYLEKRHYLSLYEVCKTIYPSLSNDAYADTFKDIFYTYFANAPLWSGENPKEHLVDLWRLVFARYKNHYCYYLLTEENNINSAYNCLLKVVNTIIMTYDKYATLLTIYATNKNDLLAKIKTSSGSITRFNDTPQVPEGDSHTLDDDEYVTNITKSKGDSETDGDTIMARIREIQDSIQNVLLNWSNEFDKIFIEEYNV